MNAENPRFDDLKREHNERVVGYYETAQPYYYFAWHGRTYGLHYGLWTGDVKSRHEAITKENEVLAELAEIKPGDMVLDAGCGVGGSAIWLAENPGALVTGLNIVQKQNEIGNALIRKRGLHANAWLEQGDYENMPFEDETFDVVWSMESIEHATDVDQFLGESFRVLRPGGRMVIAATFLGKGDVSPEQKTQMELGQAVSGCFNDFRTADGVALSMEETGFVNVMSQDVTSQVMRSSEQMTKMCKLGLPPAKIAHALAPRLVPRIMVLNNVWGTYQEGLFQSGATSYNLLSASKPDRA